MTITFLDEPRDAYQFSVEVSATFHFQESLPALHNSSKVGALWEFNLRQFLNVPTHLDQREYCICFDLEWRQLSLCGAHLSPETFDLDYNNLSYSSALNSWGHDEFDPPVKQKFPQLSPLFEIVSSFLV